MINLGQSNKDTLAKLMATENITVIHKKVPTAYFDVKSRTLCIPMLKENMSQSLIDLFTGHEVGHALYTPVDGWHDSICEKGGLFKGYLNVIEDCRIEEKVKNKYPGLRRSFYKGYEELATDDFFGIKGKDLSKLNLIDKINIHFKIGAQAQVQFSNEERPYIERCKNLKSFEEVMELASELFDRQEKKTDQKMESMTQEQLEALIEEYGLDPAEDGEDSGESIMVDSQSDGEESDGEESKTGTGKTGGNSVEDQIKEKLNKSETDEEFRKNEGRVFEDDDYKYSNTYYEITSKIKYENFIVPWKDIDAIINDERAHEERDVDTLNRAPIEKTVKTFIDNNKKIIAYMVKQFEMKKAAADYKRSRSAKTGEIDMNRLHLYQLKDDIFNRVQITPDGKNHGLVMIIDWSGSMHGSVKSTVEQASLLSMFCRRLQIPFRLFAFSDRFYGRLLFNGEFSENKTPLNHRHYGKLPIDTEGMEPWDLNRLSLLEIFNEKMSNAEFTRNMENWFQLASSCDAEWTRHACRENDKFDYNWAVPNGLYLNGTPLDASLILIRDYLIDFKKDYDLDICSFITLTDGDSHKIFHGQNVHLVDRKLNKVFKLSNNRWNNTSGILQWIKETADVKTIGFYLTKGSGRQFFNNVQSFCNASLNGYDDYSLKKRKEFNNLATSFTDGSYDLSIIINQKKLEIDYEKDELNVEVGASKSKLKSALVKAGTNKMKQRVILNKFVDQMAV